MKIHICRYRATALVILTVATLLATPAGTRLLTPPASDFAFNRRLGNTLIEVKNLGTKVQTLKDKMQIASDTLDFYFDKLVNYESAINKARNVMRLKQTHRKSLQDMENLYMYPQLEKYELTDTHGKISRHAKDRAKALESAEKALTNQ